MNRSTAGKPRLKSRNGLLGLSIAVLAATTALGPSDAFAAKKKPSKDALPDKVEIPVRLKKLATGPHPSEIKFKEKEKQKDPKIKVDLDPL
jgi:hypothetical protein